MWSAALPRRFHAISPSRSTKLSFRPKRADAFSFAFTSRERVGSRSGGIFLRSTRRAQSAFSPILSTFNCRPLSRLRPQNKKARPTSPRSPKTFKPSNVQTFQPAVNSPFCVANPTPPAPTHTAAQSTATAENTQSPSRTSLCPDTPAPNCSAENAAAHTAPLPPPAPATESPDRTGPAQSNKRQCRCTDSRTPDRSRSPACTPRSPRPASPESDTSTPETCALPQS